jgi:hypothetical protein
MVYETNPQIFGDERYFPVKFLTNFQPELSSVVMHLTRNLESGRFVVSRDAAVGHLSETNERALQWFSINLVTIFFGQSFPGQARYGADPIKISLSKIIQTFCIITSFLSFQIVKLMKPQTVSPSWETAAICRILNFLSDSVSISE